MTGLRKMLLEELPRRNYSEVTTRFYIRIVEDFSRRFHCSPGLWTTESPIFCDAGNLSPAGRRLCQSFRYVGRLVRIPLPVERLVCSLFSVGLLRCDLTLEML
jgi:hypothetical protein